MAKTGRPRKNSVEAFAAAIDACIAAFEESDDAKELTDYVLAKRLNLSIDQLDAYYEGKPDAAIARVEAREAERRAANQDAETRSTQEGGSEVKSTKKTYHGELKRLVQYRSAACTSHIARGGQVTGWIFLSKQKRWGGYSDTQRAETLAKSEVTVTLRGADGKSLL